MKVSGTVQEILSRKVPLVHTISPESTVYDAIDLMAAKNIGALVVMAGERLAGVISERDYTRNVVLKGKSSKQTSVSEIMSQKIISATPELSIQECMHLMTENRVRHLPVLQNGRVIGVVSIGDLVKWIISVQSSTIDQLEDYIAGRYPG